MKTNKNASFFSTLFNSAKTAFSLMPYHFSGMILIHIFIAILPLWGTLASRNIFNFIQSPLAKTEPFRILHSFIVYLLYLVCMKFYTVYYERYLIQFGALLDFEQKVKSILHQKCNRLNLLEYEEPSLYNSLWEAKIASINIYRLSECSITILSIVLNIIIMAGFVSQIHITFLVFIVCAAALNFADRAFSAKIQNKYRSTLSNLQKMEQATRECITSGNFAKERQVYKSFPFLFYKWNTASQNYLEKNYESESSIFKITSVLSILKTFCMIGIYILAGYLLSSKAISFANFMVSISTATHLQYQFNTLLRNGGYFLQFHLMVKPFFSFLSKEESEAKSTNTAHIAFRDVSFAYPGGQTVLHHLQLDIKKGEKIAIVGHNGAGKSTLAKLLLGLLPPTHGQVEQGISSQYCALFQDFQKYELCRDENIALSEQVPAAPQKIQQLVNELDISHIPDTGILGRTFGSIDLSGGQWQRLALARMYYQDGALLVLDEPTSAIDPLFEKELNNFIQTHAVNKTLILMSHRLSLAKLADRIFVLENGQIIEQGTHASLLASPSTHYAKLWTAQTSWYK